jgi:hypothetical protein
VIDLLQFAGAVAYFSLGIALFAQFFDWACEPRRSVLWLGLSVFILFFVVGSSMLLAWWAVR